MIEPPAVEVTIAAASKFTTSGALSDRARSFAELIVRAWQLPHLPSCEISVRSPRDHIGLGVGTQLGLSIAVGLRRFLELSAQTTAELAADAARGLRSSVGTFGFQCGGLIVDGGHSPGQSDGTLVHRLPIPDTWRFVLICPANQRGLAGTSEADAFARLPSVPDDVTSRLWQIVEDEIVKAVERADCSAFGEAVYHFGQMAGVCFGAVQGGPFASPEITKIVDTIRDYGIPGVGQSSWGPTVFAVCPSDAVAQALASWMRELEVARNCDVRIARPNNRGASIT
jgi:beta-RFAP synthase